MAVALARRPDGMPGIKKNGAPRQLVSRWRLAKDGKLVCLWRRATRRRVASRVIPLRRARKEVRHGGL